MEKKMYKCTTSQPENIKNTKKQKEIKLLTNYIPVKKTHVQSNISEYETEQSIQKNFSNKCQKNRVNVQAKSVQATRGNQFSPMKVFNVNQSNRISTNASKSSKGSFYNLNNLNIYDYFSEKVILTQKKFIDYKNNKINTLQKQLSLLKKEINLYEKKNKNNSINKSQSNSKIYLNTNKSNDTNNKNNSNSNSSQLIPKILYINKNNNKYLLVNNNNSYVSFNTCYNNEQCNNGENPDKKLEKHLSNLLTENNSDNNLKYKNNSKNQKNDNKKKLLSVIYQFKKGCYNHNNNNYEHNTKNNINNNNNNNQMNIKKENSFKANNLDKEIKNNLYFYSNKANDKQIQVLENTNSIKSKNDNNNNINVKEIKLELVYENLNERINNLFNSYFDYYNSNKKI